MQSKPVISNGERIAPLEGIRGIMAWWVVVGHVAHTVGLEIPLISNNALAVDVFISYPDAPHSDGHPWVVLGDAAPSFWAQLNECSAGGEDITARLPRRAIERMIAHETAPTVGGSVSLGFAHQFGFELASTVSPIVEGQPAARATFNGLDLERDIGHVGRYSIGTIGVA